MTKESQEFNGDLSESDREKLMLLHNKSLMAAEEQEGHQQLQLQQQEKMTDALIRDSNPAFQSTIESQLLDSLRLKSDKDSSNGKLINWSIYNAGKQTIIVL